MSIQQAIEVLQERIAFGEKHHRDVAKDYIDALKMAVEALKKQEESNE